ncbi:MAG: hypothetical protein ABJD24_17915 [Acidimicrobiales bacterium]
MKVSSVGGEIVTVDGASVGAPLVFTAAETEQLAVAEHDRWWDPPRLELRANAR